MTVIASVPRRNKCSRCREDGHNARNCSRSGGMASGVVMRENPRPPKPTEKVRRLNEELLLDEDDVEQKEELDASRQVRDPNGAWNVREFPRPTAIELYNQGMGVLIWATNMFRLIGLASKLSLGCKESLRTSST